MGFCQALLPAGLLPWPLAAPNQHSESDHCAGCLQASAGIFCPDLLLGAVGQLAEGKRVSQVLAPFRIPERNCTYSSSLFLFVQVQVAKAHCLGSTVLGTLRSLPSAGGGA